MNPESIEKWVLRHVEIGFASFFANFLVGLVIFQSDFQNISKKFRKSTYLKPISPRLVNMIHH